jgi:Mn-dependent DtxR family transcriptional regulator
LNLLPITARQHEVLATIVRLEDELGAPPSHREIARALGAGLNTVTCHLRSLEKKGVLRYPGSGVRRAGVQVDISVLSTDVLGARIRHLHAQIDEIEHVLSERAKRGWL